MSDTTPEELVKAVNLLSKNSIDTKEEQTILEHAQSLIYGDRNNAYGHPTGNFQDIADLWNAYTGIVKRKIEVKQHVGSLVEPDDGKLSTIDVAAMCILMKLARLSKNPTHMDSITDIAGYAGCMERIVKNK